MKRILFVLAMVALSWNAAHPEEIKLSDSPAPSASATPAQSATPVRNYPALKKREDDLSMPLKTASPEISPNESKIKSKIKSKKNPSHSGKPSLAATAPPSDATSTPTPTASPVVQGEPIKNAPRNLRPERPTFVPNQPDSSEPRTTSVAEPNGDKPKEKNVKRGGPAPTPTPSQ